MRSVTLTKLFATDSRMAMDAWARRSSPVSRRRRRKFTTDESPGDPRIPIELGRPALLLRVPPKAKRISLTKVFANPEHGNGRLGAALVTHIPPKAKKIRHCRKSSLTARCAAR